MVKMKDNGIEWIGEIPENWKVKKLKYIATSFQKGNGITKELISENGDTPCVRYGDIYSKYNYSFSDCKVRTNKRTIDNPKYFSNGDILFTCTGELIEEIGKSIVYLGNETCLAGGDIFIAKHNENPLFMGYALDSTYIQNQKSFGKSKLKVVHISTGEIQNLQVCIPPLEEQKRIADFLDAKCSKIDSLKTDIQKQIEVLEQYKKSVITETVTKGLNPNVRMKDSRIEWIGEIPENWEVKKLKYEFDFGKGLPITKDNLVETGLPVISYGQIHSKINNGTSINPVLLRYVKPYYQYTNPQSRVYKDDFIFADTSEDLEGCGNAVLKCDDSDLFAGYHSIILHSHKPEYSRYFAYLFLTNEWRSQLRSRVYGVKVFSITQTILKFTIVILPPLEEQKRIADFLDAKCSSIDSIISTKKQQLEKLDEYKKSLIFEYVTGKKEA